MNVRDFVTTATSKIYRKCNCSAHKLNTECKKQGIDYKKMFIQLNDTDVRCLVPTWEWK